MWLRKAEAMTFSVPFLVVPKYLFPAEDGIKIYLALRESYLYQEKLSLLVI